MDDKFPYHIEAEIAVIGSIINNPNSLIEIKEYIIPECFYEKKHQYIYEALVDLINNNVSIDFVTIKEMLDKNNTTALSGGIEYIIDITESTSMALNVHEYAKIIHEKYLIRETIKKAKNIIDKGSVITDSSEYIEFAEKEIFELSKSMRSQEFIDWQNLIQETHNKINELLNMDNSLTGLATGFKNLDDISNGLQKSDLIVIAARPSVGKTAFALNLAKNIASSNKNNNAHVAIFSLEMSAEQLMTRLLAAQCGVPISNIRTGNLDKEEQEQVHYGLDQLSKYNLFIDETPGIKIGDLKSKCRKLKIEKGLDMVVIDYLQLITTANTSPSRQQEVSEISRELKAMAKELNVPVIALSQLSRGVEARADKKPIMSDIRESGAIEQDADIIMMLYRPEYYGDNIELSEQEEIYDGKTILIISKNRNGATGEIEFKFQKEINKFISVTHKK